MESSEEDVMLFRFQRKMNTLFGMPFYVYTFDVFGQGFGKLLAGFYQYFTEIIVAMAAIGQFWAVPHVFEDMNVLCGCLSSGFHSLQVVAKSALLNKHKGRYLTHLEKVRALQKETEDFERSVFQREASGFVKYHLSQAKYINVIVIIQLVVNFMSTSAYFLPFLYDSIANRNRVDTQLTPIVVYIGTSFNYTPFFQIIILILTVAFYIINLKTVVIDNFILNLIALHTSRLTYHKNLLKETIEKEAAVGENGKNVIRAWIKEHQALSRVCLDFRDIISSYLFVEFSYILIHTCVPSFVITSTFSWTLPQKVAVFCMVAGGLIELFLMSNAGDTFSEAWRTTGDVLFQSEYFFKNEKWMKNVFLMIKHRVQKPFHLYALNIAPLGCMTFALIVRLIFSYYMTLNQIQKVKH